MIGTTSAADPAGPTTLTQTFAKPTESTTCKGGWVSSHRYWAFLSYSHADGAAARRLHRGLETYRVPRRLVGRPTAQGPAPRRFSPIFRDREELTADAHLGVRIEEALAGSAYLIVLCSPNAARSAWVNQEIIRFKSLHGEDRVLAVILSGHQRASERPGHEAEECFPPALRWRVGAGGVLTDQRAEPIAADLRPGKDGWRLTRLKLLARMLETGLDDLARRDAQRRQAQYAALAGVSGAVALAMGGLAVAALLARNEAVTQRGQAEGLVEFMIGDLSQRLEPKVRLDVMGAVADRAVAYYAVEARHGMDADALARRGRVLRQLGWIEQDRGDLVKADALFRASADSARQLLAARPRDPARLLDYASAAGRVGQIAAQRGQWQDAEAWTRDAARAADQLVSGGDRTPTAIAEQGSEHVNLGVILMQQRQLAAALVELRRGVAIQSGLFDAGGLDRGRRDDLVQALGWLADGERQSGDAASALRDREAEEQVLDKDLRQTPNDRLALDALAVSRVARARILSNQGRVAEALSLARSAAAVAEQALAQDPADTVLADDAAGAQQTLGEVALAAGDLADARLAARRALSLAGTLAAKDQGMIAWTGPRLGAARLLGVRLAAREAVGATACRNALAMAVPESHRLEALSATNPASASLARIAADAVMLRGDAAALAGDWPGARADWRRARDALARLTANPAPVDPVATRLARAAQQRLILTNRTRPPEIIAQGCGAGPVK